MEFWQQNKPFAIVVGLALAGLIFLWPSLFGLGPTIVRLHASDYARATMDIRRLEPKLEQYFPKKGSVVPVSQALRDVVAGNEVLASNIKELRGWMTFVPRFPFRIPDNRQGNERQRYVSLVYSYARTGALNCPEYTIDDPSDGVVFLAGTRNIPLPNPNFGMANMDLPVTIQDPETRIMQIALAHELGHLAIRLNIDEITAIAPLPPYTWQSGEAKIAQVYPVNVHIKCDLPTLLAFLHALDGAHGVVAQVAGGPAAGKAPVARPPADEAEDAIRPLPPARNPAEDPEDPGPGAPAAKPDAAGVPAAPARKTDAQKLVLHLGGSPSILSPDARLGTLKERFTIFRPDEKNPHQFAFVANATVTRILDPGTPKLTPADIRDWVSLAANLRALGGAAQPSPGKRIWDLLPASARAGLDEIAQRKDMPESRKADLVGDLNALLSRRDFYRKDDFASLPPSHELDGFLRLDRQALPEEQLQRFNRLLLESAFPQEIAPALVKVEAVVEDNTNLRFQPDGKAVPDPVREKDLASTRFFFVRSMKAKAVPGSLLRDRDGFLSEVTVPHLDVELVVAAITFLELQASPAAEKQRAVGGGSRTIQRRL